MLSHFIQYKGPRNATDHFFSFFFPVPGKIVFTGMI